MDFMIARPEGAQQRLFPPIKRELYSLQDAPADLTPDQQTARAVLALANVDFTRWQRLLGWKLDTLGRIGRLLFYHRTAMAAELTAQWPRADFFWQMVYTDFKRLSGQSEVWEILSVTMANRPGVAVMSDPKQLLQRLVDEIFIDIHCAFYNGQIHGEASGDRAFVHIDYLVKELLPWSGLSRDIWQDILGPLQETRLVLYKEAKQWKQAIQVCTDMLQRFPGLVSFQNTLAELHFSQTVSALKKQKMQLVQWVNLMTLSRSIKRAQRLRQDYPYNLTVFDVLGQLYHLQAVTLARLGKLSKALVAGQKALTFVPTLAEGQETQKQLVEMMQKLQSQIRTIRADLAKRPGTMLDARGQLMWREAKRGFTPLDAYIQSSEAKQISKALGVARDRSTWQQIGLSAPAERWDEQAHALRNGLDSVFEQRPADQAGLEAAWAEVTSRNTDLAAVDAAPIKAFLARSLFSRAGEKPVIRLFPPTELPVLTVTPAKRQGNGAPFAYWLVSRQDVPLKLQAVIAIMLMLAAGGLTVRDFLARRVRNTVYQQIMTAAVHHDYQRLIAGAEAFLAHPAPLGQDGRQGQVIDLYNEALVRWFIAHEGELDAPAQARIKRYHTLVNDSKR